MNTTELPPPQPLSEGLWSGARWKRFEAIETCARAVIAAGRPHGCKPGPNKTFDCPQCAAWDALAELLKAP